MESLSTSQSSLDLIAHLALDYLRLLPLFSQVLNLILLSSIRFGMVLLNLSRIIGHRLGVGQSVIFKKCVISLTHSKSCIAMQK